MPSRIIKDSICESSGLSKCSIFSRDLFDRLITYADDYGRFNADTQIMLARLYPREMDCVTQEDIVTSLIELSGVGKISFYTSGPREKVYGCFPNWSSHQRIRESKAKCPDPDDTTVNDWYLQRFIPLDLKVEIIERDGFKCQLCGKFITSDRNAKRLAKHGCGMYHIDHIVPVSQGGRATLENLRLTCPSCNLKRKRAYSFDEILEFTKCDNAEVCGKPPQLAANRGLNPIQSESESESESPPTPRRGAVDVFSEYAGEDDSLLSALRDYEAMRNKIKKPMTDRAKKQLCTKLDGLSDKFGRVELINEAILHCWQSVYPPNGGKASGTFGASGRNTARSGGEVKDWGLKTTKL